MRRDAVATHTGLILAVAGLLLAITLSLAPRETRPALPDYGCVLPIAEPQQQFAEPPSTFIVPSGIPASCRRYVAAVHLLAQCPALPEPSRQALIDAVDSAMTAWQNIPDGAIPALTTACHRPTTPCARRPHGCARCSDRQCSLRAARR